MDREAYLEQWRRHPGFDVHGDTIIFIAGAQMDKVTDEQLEALSYYVDFNCKFIIHEMHYATPWGEKATYELLAKMWNKRYDRFVIRRAKQLGWI